MAFFGKGVNTTTHFMQQVKGRQGNGKDLVGKEKEDSTYVLTVDCCHEKAEIG